MYIDARGPLEKNKPPEHNPPVFTGNGSLGPENLTKTKPEASEGAQIYKIETRIYKLMFILLVYMYTYILTCRPSPYIQGLNEAV